jgi:hypothetical protein
VPDQSRLWNGGDYLFMKQFMAIFSLCPGDICVYAETRDEARKEALKCFSERVDSDLEVVEVKARTERCDICQYTYIPSDVIGRDGERLCVYCYDDKFGLQSLMPEDIPF